MYKLLYELPNDLRPRILGQEEILEISEYSLVPSLPPSTKYLGILLKAARTFHGKYYHTGFRKAVLNVL